MVCSEKLKTNIYTVSRKQKTMIADIQMTFFFLCSLGPKLRE